MSRARSTFATAVAVPLLAAATTLTAMLSWRDFTETPGGFLLPLVAVGLVVAATGFAARWARWPAGVVIGLQTLLGLMAVSVVLVGVPVPLGGAWSELRYVVTSAVDSARTYAPPVPDEAPPVDALLVLGGLACLLLVDLLAATLRRPALVGLPLLTVYSVPVGLLGTDLTWWVFGATALGYLGLLVLGENEHVARWGRAMSGSRPGAGRAGFRSPSSIAAATGLAGVATLAALVVPLAIPTLDTHLFDIGRGPGGDSTVQLDNPMTDLQRDLRRGADVPLLTMTTGAADPSYLRIAVLTKFNGEQWTTGDRDIPSAQGAFGELPPLPGLDPSVPVAEHPFQIEIGGDFHSTFLPTPELAGSVRAPGDWRYDLRTRDVIAGNKDLDAADTSYTGTSLEPAITAALLERAGSSFGQVSDAFTTLPPDLPDQIGQLAVQVTAQEPSRFGKLVALQNWFRQTGGFVYDLRRARAGNGTDALVQFLSESEGGRRGYCEQFASAYAVMARTLGLPARVAVGFLSPEKVAQGVYVFSAHDLHAWPEVYLDGAGWVRFEPTPAARAASPSYTRDVSAGPTTLPTGTGLDPGAQEPSRGASSSAGSEPTRTPVEEKPDAAATSQQDAGSLLAWWMLPAALGVVALVLLALLPSRVRRRRRDRRLGGTGRHGGAPAVEDLWAEVRDTATDLGLPWDAARSPRSIGGGLTEFLGDPGAEPLDRPAHGAEVAPHAAASLDRLVVLVERERYSPAPAQVTGALRRDVVTVLASLEAGATPRERRRAQWWPASVLGRGAHPLRRTPARRAPVSPVASSTTAQHEGREPVAVGTRGLAGPPDGQEHLD